MTQKVKQLAPLFMSLVLIWPLLGNKSCSEALQEAEQAETSSSTPALPDDSAEADQLLKSGGPEVLSPPVDSDQDAYQGDDFDGDDFEESEREGDSAEEQERVGDNAEEQERMGDTFEREEDEGDQFEWDERNAEPEPGPPPAEPAPAPEPF